MTVVTLGDGTAIPCYARTTTNKRKDPKLSAWGPYNSDATYPGDRGYWGIGGSRPVYLNRDKCGPREYNSDHGLVLGVGAARWRR